MSDALTITPTSHDNVTPSLSCDSG